MSSATWRQPNCQILKTGVASKLICALSHSDVWFRTIRHKHEFVCATLGGTAAGAGLRGMSIIFTWSMRSSRRARETKTSQLHVTPLYRFLHFSRETFLILLTRLAGTATRVMVRQSVRKCSHVSKLDTNKLHLRRSLTLRWVFWFFRGSEIFYGLVSWPSTSIDRKRISRR